MLTSYNTIQSNAAAETTERRSRFIASIARAEREEDAVNFINALKKEHWNASHNVYAYILKEGSTARFSDDGEPQGTAGIPVLEVLKKEELTDVVMVVTRYFGGVLLGAGGLVRAYSKAAKAAVDAAGRIDVSLCKTVHITTDYTLHAKAQSAVYANGGKIADTEFAENVRITAFVRHDKVRTFTAQITDETSGRAVIELGGDVWV